MVKSLRSRRELLRSGSHLQAVKVRSSTASHAPHAPLYAAYRSLRNGLANVCLALPSCLRLAGLSIVLHGMPEPEFHDLGIGFNMFQPQISCFKKRPAELPTPLLHSRPYVGKAGWASKIKNQSQNASLPPISRKKGRKAILSWKGHCSRRTTIAKPEHCCAFPWSLGICSMSWWR